MDSKVTAFLSLAAVIILIVIIKTTTIEVNYYLVTYVIFASVMLITMLNLLYRSERVIAAISIFILFVLVFTFFGIRWFKTGFSAGNTMNPDGRYPLVINKCPDYMSLTSRTLTNGNKIQTCIDTVGLGSGRSTWTSSTTPAIATTQHYFDYVYNPSASLSSQIDTLKTQADSQGLKWEGITTD